VAETALVAILFFRPVATSVVADDLDAVADDYGILVDETLAHNFYTAPHYLCLDHDCYTWLLCYSTHRFRRSWAPDYYRL
jgi:hypothetical protein